MRQDKGLSQCHEQVGKRTLRANLEMCCCHLCAFLRPLWGNALGKSDPLKGTAWDVFPLIPSDHLALYDLLHSVSTLKGRIPRSFSQPLPS